MPADGSYARGSVTPGNREILWILRSPASRGRAHQTALDLLTDSGNPLLGPFGTFNTPDMLVRFAPDPLGLGLGLGPLCPLLCLRRFAFEASEHSFGLRHCPRYALVSFSLSSRNSLVRLRLDLRDPSTRFSRPLPSLREFGLQTREVVLRFSIELCL